MNDMTPSEPTLADVLVAVNGLAAGVDGLTAGVDGLTADVHGLAAGVGQIRTEMSVRFDRVEAKLEQVRADVAQVRADVASDEGRSPVRCGPRRRRSGSPAAARGGPPCPRARRSLTPPTRIEGRRPRRPSILWREAVISYESGPPG